jgi:hypothetical protein
MDLVVAALILGFCGALPCPIGVASCPVRRSRGWGEGVAYNCRVWNVYS